MNRQVHAGSKGAATMRSLRSLFAQSANVFFDGLTMTNRLNPLTQPGRFGVEAVYDIPYAGSTHPAHRLDLYRPRDMSAGPLPVVLYLHGGGFSLLSKETHWWMAVNYAQAGYVVCNISYRLADKHPFPAALDDAADALCWVARNIEHWGGDPERLILAGESAGANLATALAISTCYRRPERCAQKAWHSGLVPSAVVAGCGLLQVSDPGRFARRRKLPWWISTMINNVSADYLHGVTRDSELADPLLILERGEQPERPLPAFFAFAGTRDPILDDTRRLGRALATLGVPHEIDIYPGELHAFHAWPLWAASRRCWRETFWFLRQHVAERRIPRESVRVPLRRVGTYE
jgi:acetyl esterase